MIYSQLVALYHRNPETSDLLCTMFSPTHKDNPDVFTHDISSITKVLTFAFEGIIFRQCSFSMPNSSFGDMGLYRNIFKDEVIKTCI